MTHEMYLALTIAGCILAVFVCFVLGFFCYFLCQIGDYFCARYRLVVAQEDTEKERYKAICDRQSSPFKVVVRKVVQK